MTQAALEALVNAYLASNQPINAAAMHRPSMQKVIDELYDGQSRGDVLAEVMSVVSLSSGDKVLVIRGAEARLAPATLFAGMKFCGGWDASGDLYPATGGSGAGGAVKAGDVFYLTVGGELDGGEWPVKTMLIALVDTPAQDNTKWRII